MNKIIQGESLEQLKLMPENSIDAVCCDPPYGLSFMGKKWDYDVPSTELWAECLRVLKPGGYLLAFAGTRTQHRMAVKIEDAGFEIRDMIAWVYGSGFPKSLNIGKAVDKLQGNEREDLGEYDPRSSIDGANRKDRAIGGQQVAPSKTSKLKLTKGNSEFEGWGTALKPALEPITVARKPLSEKTVAANALKWGTGGINIDGCRVGTEDKLQPSSSTKMKFGGNSMLESSTMNDPNWVQNTLGRFPANLIHDGSDEVETLLGDPARFFYCAKASKSERNKGCEELDEKTAGECTDRKEGSAGLNSPRAGAGRTSGSKNNHPTVKPIALMEYLVKLVSREGATVLDPFAGSGSTGLACKNLNRNYILIEREADYIPIIEARLK